MVKSAPAGTYSVKTRLSGGTASPQHRQGAPEARRGWGTAARGVGGVWGLSRAPLTAPLNSPNLPGEQAGCCPSSNTTRRHPTLFLLSVSPLSSLQPPPPPPTSRLQFSSLHSAFFHLCFLGSEDSPSRPPKNKLLSLNQQSEGRATPGFSPRGCPRAPELTCPQPSCGSPALWMCWCRRSAELTVKPFPQSAQA